MAHHADDACGSIATLLHRTLSQLDSVARHVEAELATNTGTGVNLLALLQRARRLQRDFASIVEDNRSVEDAKRRLAAAAMGEMAESWEGLQELRGRSGLRMADGGDQDLEALREAIGGGGGGAGEA